MCKIKVLISSVKAGLNSYIAHDVPIIHLHDSRSRGKFLLRLPASRDT